MSVWWWPRVPDYRKLFQDSELRLAHSKMFKHTGPRSDETDELAEAAARHALTDAYPGVQDITCTWTHHNIPDVWLLFVVGRTELKEQP